MGDVEVEGADELAKRLNALARGLPEIVTAGLAEVLVAVATNVVSEAPVRTGALVRSIDIGLRSQTIGVVGTHVPYGDFVVNGARGMRPNDFLQRGLDKTPVDRILTEAAEDAVAAAISDAGLGRGCRSSSSTPKSFGRTWVDGYVKKNGVRVSGYYRD